MQGLERDRSIHEVYTCHYRHLSNIGGTRGSVSFGRQGGEGGERGICVGLSPDTKKGLIISGELSN